MSIRKRRSKTGKWDVYVNIDGKRYRIAVVNDECYARAISNVVKYAVVGDSKFASPSRLLVLQDLSQEAYETLASIDDRYNYSLAEEYDYAAYKENERIGHKLAEYKAMQNMQQQFDKLEHITRAPVPDPRNTAYAAVPPPMFPVTQYGDGMPSSPGVYFVWSNDNCDYVGQSVNLCKRVRRTHEKIVDNDWVSFLLFDVRELVFAESYYIGIVRPQRNFAGFRKCSGDANDL